MFTRTVSLFNTFNLVPLMFHELTNIKQAHKLKIHNQNSSPNEKSFTENPRIIIPPNIVDKLLTVQVSENY